MICAIFHPVLSSYNATYIVATIGLDARGAGRPKVLDAGGVEVLEGWHGADLVNLGPGRGAGGGDLTECVCCWTGTSDRDVAVTRR